MQRWPPLFDANGPVGYGATAPPEFPTCADLLRHMDRLGIPRALVWSVQARDHHPATGNARLLAEVQATDPKGERLVPSLVIAPSMLHEPRSVDELIAAMRTHKIRALRVFPGTLRHKLRHLQPLLKKVARFHPVLFVSVREVADDQDLLALAESFPQIPLVCMHAMWGQIFNFSLLDLMRRRPNLLTDTSWVHTRGTIALVAREFGTERLVFATGGKAHNGAAVAALMHANITDAQRAAIAHGNLERLLGLRATRAAAPAIRTSRDETLWAKFRRGELLGVNIIDAHGHLGTTGFWPLPEREIEDQVAAALPEMDRLGIRTIIVSGEDALFADPLEGNAKLEEKAGRHGERIRGYFGFNPYYADRLAPRLDEFFTRPFFVGFKFLCSYWRTPVTDRRFEPALRYAQEHHLPILLHTWDGPFDSPAMLRDIVRAYPDAIFLLGHSGGGDKGRLEAEELALANRNVYLEWCGSFTSRIPWEETLVRVSAERVVFGTDAVFHDFAWELGRFLSLDLPAESLLPVLGENMRGILARRR